MGGEEGGGKRGEEGEGVLRSLGGGGGSPPSSLATLCPHRARAGKRSIHTHAPSRCNLKLPATPPDLRFAWHLSGFSTKDPRNLLYSQANEF
jgi:hypothetical protein